MCAVFSGYLRLGVPGGGAKIVHNEDGLPVRARFGPTQVSGGACLEVVVVAVVIVAWLLLVLVTAVVAVVVVV